MHFQRQFGKHSAQPRSLHSQLSRTESQMSCLNESHACAIVCAENFKILEPGAVSSRLVHMTSTIQRQNVVI